MQDQQWVPALSKLFLTIAAAFAEAERDRIRERVAQVKRDKEGALEGIPEQQAAIAAPGSCGPPAPRCGRSRRRRRRSWARG
jgi:hypothetical protein